ncbi:MAG: citrate synthase [Planctomycetota bacterium]|jgi:citrate synthase|nr:citrate synthase [Planctomycetota bacterium]
MGSETAILEYNGKRYELPVVTGSENEKAIDITALRQQSGLITYDPAFGNTGACASAITFIDGEKGILRYRGYPIEQLAERAEFIEVAYLLIFGELPSPEELTGFRDRLNHSSLIHEDMHHFFTGVPSTAHPMAILSTMVASLSGFYPVPDELDFDAEYEILANLISQVRTLAAFSYKMKIGEPMVYPSYKFRYVANFLNMMFSSPVHKYEIDDEVVRALEVFLILHADHEQNCSTSSVRIAGSSLANIYAIASAGISALWGRRHGGANQQVIEMLTDIHQNGDTAQGYVDRAKDKKTRLMGFGHRVYKNYDPRAKVMRDLCHKLLPRLEMAKDPLFAVAMQLEEIAMQDAYFIERNLYPNVDFYSGLVLRAIGIPTDMFTVLFTIGRMPGWLAHWREMIHDEGFRIARPRQLYVGETERSFFQRGNAPHYRHVKMPAREVKRL